MQLQQRHAPLAQGLRFQSLFLCSVTPPRHVMAELAAEVQGRLRM